MLHYAPRQGQPNVSRHHRDIWATLRVFRSLAFQATLVHGLDGLLLSLGQWGPAKGQISGVATKRKHSNVHAAEDLLVLLERLDPAFQESPFCPRFGIGAILRP